MLTGDGLVKILDFGLAKLAGSAGLTRAGFCVGTPSYMSPEQARGEVDQRTDLWSLGVVLYEMLTGLLPFRAESDPGIVHAVLHDDPPPLARWRPDVPPELERIVTGLLKKDPGDRYPTAEHVLGDLRMLSGPPTRTQMSTEFSRSPARTRGWMWIGAAVVVVLGIGAFLMTRPRPEVGTHQEAVQLTRQAGSERQPAFGSDFFVYTKLAGGDTDIFRQRVEGQNPQNLTDGCLEDDSAPAVSPDGLQIAYRSECDGGGIFIMGSTGESARRLIDSGTSRPGRPTGRRSSSPTKRSMKPSLRTTESRLTRVRVSDGAATLLGTGDAVQPNWSPSGQRIAYWSFSTATGRRSIWTIRNDGQDPVEVIGDEKLNWHPVWSPDGRYLYFLSDRGGSQNVWRIRIDEASGRVLGQPESVSAPATAVSGLSLSRDGHRILYATDDSQANVETAELDPGSGEVRGGLKPVTGGSWSIVTADISPDGERIAFYTQAPEEELFVVPTSGGEPRQLTRDTFKDRVPRWSPDGRSILFYSNRSGKYEAWKIGADGSGLEQLTTLDRAVYNPVWSPDGRHLAFNLGSESGAVLDLGLPLERRRPQPLAEQGRMPTPFAPDSWSPDGRWLAGYRDPDGFQLYSFENHRFEKLSDQGTYVTWLHDSRRLLYLDQGRLRLFDLAIRSSRELLTPPAESAFLRVAVSRDDRTLCLVRSADEGNLWMLTLK